MEITVEVPITPEAMAQKFWAMSSDEQCKFFEELGRAIGDEVYSAQLQWWYLEKELRANSLARETLMDLAAPLYWHTLQARYSV